MLQVSFTYHQKEFNLYFNTHVLKHFENHSLEVRNIFLKEFALAFVSAPGYLEGNEAYIDKIFKKKSPVAHETPNRFNFIYISKRDLLHSEPVTNDKDYTPYSVDIKNNGDYHLSHSGFIDLTFDDNVLDKQKLDTLRLATVGPCSFLYTDKFYKLDEFNFEGNNAYIRIKNSSIDKLIYVDRKLKQFIEIPRTQFQRIDEKLTNTLGLDKSIELSLQDLDLISATTNHTHTASEKILPQFLPAMQTELFIATKNDEASAIPDFPIPQEVINQMIIRPTAKNIENSYEYKEENAFQLFELIPGQEQKLETFKSKIKTYKKDLTDVESELTTQFATYEQILKLKNGDYDQEAFLNYAKTKFDALKKDIIENLAVQKANVGEAIENENNQTEIKLDDTKHEGLAYSVFITTVKSHYDSYYQQLKPLLLFKQLIAHAIYQAAFNYFYSDKADHTTFNTRFKEFNIYTTPGTNRLSSIEECYQHVGKLSLTDLQGITQNLLNSSKGWVESLSLGLLKKGENRCFEKLKGSLNACVKKLAVNEEIKTDEEIKQGTQPTIFQTGVNYSLNNPDTFAFSPEALDLEKTLNNSVATIKKNVQNTIDECLKSLDIITSKYSKENILNNVTQGLAELNDDVENYKYRLQLEHIQKKLEESYQLCDEENPFRGHLDIFKNKLVQLLNDEKTKTEFDESSNLQQHLDKIVKDIQEYNLYKKIEAKFNTLDSRTSDQHPLHYSLTQFKNTLQHSFNSKTGLVERNTNLSALKNNLTVIARNINNVNRFLAIKKELDQMSVTLNIQDLPNFEEKLRNIPEEYENIKPLIKTIRNNSFQLGKTILTIQSGNFAFKTATGLSTKVKELEIKLNEIKAQTEKLHEQFNKINLQIYKKTDLNEEIKRYKFIKAKNKFVEEIKSLSTTIQKLLKPISLPVPPPVKDLPREPSNPLPVPPVKDLPRKPSGPLPISPVGDLPPLPKEICDLIIRILQECDWRQQCWFGKGEKIFKQDYDTIQVPKGISELLEINMEDNKGYQLTKDGAQQLLARFEKCAQDSLTRSANSMLKYSLFGVRTSLTKSFYEILSNVTKENPKVMINKLQNLYEKSPKYKEYQPQPLQQKIRI